MYVYFEAVLYFKHMDGLSFGTTTENSSVPGTTEEKIIEKGTLQFWNELGEGKINIYKGKNIVS